MRRLLALCSLAAMVGCAGAEDADVGADTPEAMAPTISLADLTGTWSIRTSPLGADSTIVEYEMTATDSRTGWTITFPDREPLPATVDLVDGDSVVISVGPYESLLRSGVMVRVRSVARLTDGTMTGTLTARYETTEPDSILQGRFQGTRAMDEEPTMD